LRHKRLAASRSPPGNARERPQEVVDLVQRLDDAADDVRAPVVVATAQLLRPVDHADDSSGPGDLANAAVADVPLRCIRAVACRCWTRRVPPLSFGAWRAGMARYASTGS
jgi:hypothetical protein